MAVARPIEAIKVEQEKFHVELSLRENNIYEAQVVEIHDKKALISFDNGYYPNREVLLKDIWYAPTCLKEVVDYQENLEVDGYFNLESLNHQIWIQGTISKSENGGHLFTYQNNEEQIATILLNDLTYLRLRHVGKTLDTVKFYTLALKVPTLMQKYFKIDTNLEYLRKIFSRPLVFYKDNEETLYFVTSQRRTYDRAVRMQQDLLMFVTEVAQKRESCQKPVDNIVEGKCYVKEYSPGRYYLRQSIGANRVNLKRARAIPEICHISVNSKTGSFRIFGMTEEAVEEAESILQYSRKYYVIPKKYLGQIVGKGFANFTKIAEKSGASLHLPDEADYENLGIPRLRDGDVAILISKQPSAIDRAVTYIRLQLDCIQQIKARQNYNAALRRKIHEKIDIVAATLGTSTRRESNELPIDSDDDDSSTTSSHDTSTDDELPKFDVNEYLDKDESFEEDENFKENENFEDENFEENENFEEDENFEEVENLDVTQQQSSETDSLLEMASAKLTTIFEE